MNGRCESLDVLDSGDKMMSQRFLCLEFAPLLGLPLLPQLSQADLLVIVLVQDLGRSQVEVLLRDVHSALSQRIHASLGADTFQLSARTPIHLLGNLGQVDASGQVHGSRMDPEDICAGFDSDDGLVM